MIHFLRLRYQQRKAELQSNLSALQKAIEACSHKDLAIIQAQRLSYEDVIITSPIHTVVLKRCRKCGEHLTQTLCGDWQLSDLLRTESEVSELQGMYAK